MPQNKYILSCNYYPSSYYKEFYYAFTISSIPLWHIAKVRYQFIQLFKIINCIHSQIMTSTRFNILKTYLGIQEMSQQVSLHTTLPEDLSRASNTNCRAAHNCLWLQLQSIHYCLLASTEIHTHMYIHIHTQVNK